MLVVAMLTACAASLQSNWVEYDQYSAVYVVTGTQFPNQSMGKALLTNQYTTLWMRGTFNKNGTDRLIQLYVQRLGDEFNIQQYSSASDNTGVPLQVHRIKVDLSRQLISRVSEDQVAIDLPRDFLDARKDQGLDIRLIGYNNVSLIVKVPAAYIAEFLLSFPGLETGTN